MEVKKIIKEVAALPVEERILIADSILRSLNPVNTDIENEWIKTAKKRLEELRLGKVKTIPGEEVFKKIQDNFS